MTDVEKDWEKTRKLAGEVATLTTGHSTVVALGALALTLAGMAKLLGVNLPSIVRLVEGFYKDSLNEKAPPGGANWGGP